MNRFSSACILLGLCAAPALGQGEPAPPTAEQVAEVLDAEALRLLATLPIQEAGRVKPLDTVAQFKLLRLRETRAAYTPEGRKLSSIEWLAHCLLYPELARTYEVFMVRDSAVLDMIGFAVDDKKKRDRYSYAELEPARQRLFEAFEPLQGKSRQELDRLQRQLVDLHNNVLEFELLAHHLDFARFDIATGIHPLIQAAFQREGQAPPDRVPFSAVVARGPQLVALVRRLSEGTDLPPAVADLRDSGLGAVEQLLRVIQGLGMRSVGLTMIPPSEDDAETWISPDGVAKVSFDLDPHIHPEEIALLQRWEALVASRGDPAAFKSVLRGLHEQVREQAARADAEGQPKVDLGKLDMEVDFYRWDFFYRALLMFVLGFVAIAISWLIKPGTRLDKGLVFAGSALTGIGLGLSVAGIIFRCVLRSRPPVSTLYETILFIAACAVFVALVMEWINRQRVGLALAPTLGAVGMFLAGRYEEFEAIDTMPQLQAVLDTNFWLATHVTTVTLGYSAGLLAGALGHVYLIGQMVGLKRGDRTWYRGLARMIYGVIGFGLVFSIVGTILGGVWANDSWGRFWGWDPKENGALMIVLWELAIVHARFGGYLRDWGLAFWTAAGCAVVAFSWWGVNLLGVGLHSYGFTAGVKRVLTGYYGAEALFLVACVGWWAFARAARTGSDGEGPAQESKPVEAQAKEAQAQEAQAKEAQPTPAAASAAGEADATREDSAGPDEDAQA